MAWYQADEKPLLEPMTIQLIDTYMRRQNSMYGYSVSK